MTSRPEVSPDVVAVDLSRFSSRTFCSWNDLGWRSVLLRRFENAPATDNVYHAPVKDQLLVLVTRGRTSIETWSGAKWRKAEYQPGSIGMTAPGRETRLRWRTDSSDTHTVLHLYLPGKVMQDAAAVIWGTELRPNVFPDTLATSDPVVQAVFQGIAEAAASGLDDMYAEAAAAFLAVHLFRRHAGMPHISSPQETDWRVQRAIEFMHSHLDGQLSLRDIADSVNLSTYHLLRLFNDATGQPPRRYLTRLRVERASRHLERGELSITEIAFLCGFSSSSHLSAAFRKEMGCSPTAYRRQRRS